MGALSNPISYAIRISKQVFVFVLAQSEGPPQKIFGFNGNVNGKMTKINKMAKSHFSGVQNGSQSVLMEVIGEGYLY